MLTATARRMAKRRSSSGQLVPAAGAAAESGGTTPRWTPSPRASTSMSHRARRLRILILATALAVASICFVLSLSERDDPQPTPQHHSRLPDRPAALELEGARPPAGGPKPIAEDPVGRQREVDSEILVVDSVGGAPVQQARIVRATDTIVLGTTDAAGRSAFHSGDATDLVVVATGFAAKRVPKETLAPSLTRPVRIALDRLVTIRGRVLDPLGQPAAGARVAVVPLDAGFESWPDPVDGLQGYWGRGMLGRAFRTITDADGRFIIPHPGTRSTLRIATEAAVWLPSNDVDFHAEWNPATEEERVFQLRALVHQVVECVDSVSGALVDPGRLLIFAVPPFDPVFPASLPDPLQRTPGRDLVLGALPEGVHRARVRVEGAPLLHQPFAREFEVEPGSRSAPLRVELDPIPDWLKGTLVLTLPEPSAQRVVLGFRRQSVPGDAQRRLGVLGAGAQRELRISLPAGMYVIEPEEGGAQYVDPVEGRVGVWNAVPRQTVDIRAGQESIHPLDTKPRGLLALRMSWPAGERPAQLDIYPTSPGASPAFRPVTWRPAPDVVYWYLGFVVDGQVTIAATGMEPHEVTVSMPPPAAQTREVVWRRK